MAARVNRSGRCAGSVGLALGALAWLAPASAGASGASRARLVYERGAGAQGCPNEADLRKSVAERLGYDPFPAAAGPGDPVVRVSVERRAGELTAELVLSGADGAVKGRRTLSSRASTCGELASSLAMSISIALDPASLTAPPAPEPAEVPPPAETAEERSAPPPPPPPSPLAWQAAAGAGAALGEAPAVGPTFLLSLGMRLRAVSVDLEGRADLPAGTSVEGGSVSSSTAWMTLVPCLRWSVVGVCALGSAGVIRAQGAGVSGSSFTAAAGVRGLVQVPVAAWLALRAGGDLTTPLESTRLLVGGREAWTSPALAGVLWAGCAVPFP
jgi:hypothetical protein